MNKTIASILIPMLTIFAAQTSAADLLGPSAKKKIIEFSWGNPTPEYLARNLELIETYVPHDGLGIDISKVITLPNGKKTLNNWHNFTKIRFRRASPSSPWLPAAARAARSIPTTWPPVRPPTA